MSYRYSNLFTSIEVSDISPDKTKSDRLLEVKILAWQRDREDVDKKWSLFSWYGDISFEGKDVEIVDITTTSEYTNKFFGKDISDDKKSISGLGFTQDPFGSHNPAKFIAGIITISIGSELSSENPLKINVSPVTNERNQSNIPLKTVAAYKGIPPGLDANKDLRDRIGKPTLTLTEIPEDKITQIDEGNNPPTGTVSIDGEPNVGINLSYSTDISDPENVSGDITSTWQISKNQKFWDDVISADKYTIKKEDINKYLRLKLSYVDGENLNEIVLSDSIKVNESSDDIIINGPSGSDIFGGFSSIEENNSLVHNFTSNKTVNWAISGGIDKDKFKIDQKTGSLTFKETPNYEDPLDYGKNNQYDVIVEATWAAVSDIIKFDPDISNPSGIKSVTVNKKDGNDWVKVAEKKQEDLFDSEGKLKKQLSWPFRTINWSEELQFQSVYEDAEGEVHISNSYWQRASSASKQGIFEIDSFDSSYQEKEVDIEDIAGTKNGANQYIRKNYTSGTNGSLPSNNIEFNTDNDSFNYYTTSINENNSTFRDKNLNDYFSIRWETYIRIPETGTYKFKTTTDDGSILTVRSNNKNGKLLGSFSDWEYQGDTVNSTGDILLEKGSVVWVRFDYFEHGGGAVARLHWDKTINNKTENETIPVDVMYLSESAAIGKVYQPVKIIDQVQYWSEEGNVIRQAQRVTVTDFDETVQDLIDSGSDQKDKDTGDGDYLINIVNNSYSLYEVAKDPDGLTNELNIQWQISDDGEEWSDLSNESKYISTSNDEGKKLKAIVKYTDDKGFQEEIKVKSVNIPFVNDGEATFSISGELEVGKEIKLGEEKTDPDGLGDYTYQWQISNDGIVWSERDIDDLTYKITTNDEGKSYRAVIKYKDDQGFSEEVITSAVNIPLKDDGDATFSISGDISLGDELKISTDEEDPDGTGELNYQWQSSLNGVDWNDLSILEKYTIKQNDIDSKFRAIISYTDDDGFKEEVTTSSSIFLTNDGSATYSIDGEAEIDKSLSVKSVKSDPDGDGRLSYLWEISSDGGENWDSISRKSTLKIGAADEFSVVRAVISYEDGQGFEEEISTDNFNIPYFNDGSASFQISGKAEISEVLSIKETKIDPDGTGDIEIMWQVSDGDENWKDLTSENSYEIKAIDLGKKIRAKINYDDQQGFNEEVILSPTDKITNKKISKLQTFKNSNQTIIDLDFSEKSYIDGLLNNEKGNPIKWSTDSTYGDEDSSTTVISYSFPGLEGKVARFDYLDDLGQPINSSSFNLNQRENIRKAFSNISNFINVDFVEVEDSIAEVGTIRLAIKTITDEQGNYREGIVATATPPNENPDGGDIWFNKIFEEQNKNITFKSGNILASESHTEVGDITVLYHEIFHALGLEHPGDNNKILFPDEFNSREYTLMAAEYSEDESIVFTESDNEILVTSTPMVYDIASLQYLYGPNISYNLRDTNYTYKANNPVIETIWDGGGIDTIDLSDLSNTNDLSLIEGSYSNLKYDVNWQKNNNLAIAFDTVIENAIGGKGNDLIKGNKYNNNLDGGPGDDEITPGPGNDTVIGGEGYDIAILSGNKSDYIFDFSESEVTLSDSRDIDGKDVFRSIELLRFADVDFAITPTVISTESLIKSEEEIKLVKTFVGDDNVLEIYISAGDDDIEIFDEQLNENVETTSLAPEDWQFKSIRDVLRKINNDIGLTVKEIDNPNEADAKIFIHGLSDHYSFSGSLDPSFDDPIRINIPNDEDTSKEVWNKIFVHEVGHFLGLEHPWDKDDGDFAFERQIDNIPTIMGKDSTYNNEFMSYFQEVDINALTEIWGENESTNEIKDDSDSDLDNLAPIITGPSGISGEESNAIAVIENVSDIYTFKADEEVTWSLVEGGDSDDFSINSENGKLSFSLESNYNNPQDNNLDNSYELVIKATDLVGFSSIQNITVVVKPSSSSNNKYESSTYQFVKANSWDEAQSKAQDLGGYLVSINSEEENKFLIDNYSFLPNYDLAEDVDEFVAWIGYTDIREEGNWEWTSGETISYENWNTGEPNQSGLENIENTEDYADIHLIVKDENKKIGGWDDNSSSSIEYGIVEIKTVDEKIEPLNDVTAPIVTKLNLGFNSEKRGFDISAEASDDDSGIEKITIGIQNPLDSSLSKFDLVFNNDSLNPLYEYFYPLDLSDEGNWNLLSVETFDLEGNTDTKSVIFSNMDDIQIEGSLNIPTGTNDSGETKDTDDDETNLEEDILTEPYQHVYFKNEKQLFSPEKEVKIDFQYTTSDLDQNLTGLNINIHYNSRLLSLSESEENGILDPIQAAVYKTANLSDKDNLDNDSSTDKLVNIVWSDIFGNFPGKDLPTKLASIKFNTPSISQMIDEITGEQINSIPINISSSETSIGYDFLGGKIILEPGQDYNLDVDGDNKVTALGDGLMIIRKLFGAAFAGESLTDKAMSGDATRTVDEIHEYIQSASDNMVLDVDGDNKVTALGDGLMIIRKLFGAAFAGESLTDKAMSGDATRTVEEIHEYIREISSL